MKELSLNLLDVATNSITAGATTISLKTIYNIPTHTLTMTIEDDGCGMSKEMLDRVCDPFTTSRTTRKVGLGLPLFRQSAEGTGGSFQIDSTLGKGTVVTATFKPDNIDCMPMGDIISTVTTLVSGSPDIDFVFSDVSPKREVYLDTREMREALGEGVSLALLDVQIWMAEYLKEQYNN